MKAALRAPAGILLLATVTAAQTPNWTRAATTSAPSARAGHAMAYDTHRARVVLFGGASKGTLNDTWEWNGKVWTRIRTTTTPPARVAHAMTYDPIRRKTILFGGYGNGYRDDMWEFDGKDWARLRPKNVPTGRSDHLMVYDANRRRIVLFGGRTRTGGLTDTWEWNGSDWKYIQTPQPTAGQAMAYDASRKRVVLLGALTSSGVFYEWTGAAWIRRGALPGRPIGGMAYDPIRKRLVVFGVFRCIGTSCDARGETWESDGVRSTKMSPTRTPTVRWNHATVYDEARQRVFVFGGADIAQHFAETWTYGLAGLFGTMQPYGATCGPTLRAAAGSRPVLGRRFTLDSKSLPTTSSTAILTVGSSNLSVGGLPLPLRLDPFGLKGCLLHTSLDIVLTFPIRAGAGSVSVQVPNDSRLLGARVFVQSAAGAKASDGGAILVGNR